MTDGRKRLLVVDDNEDNLELLAMRLEGKGYEVVRATGGRDALSRVSDTKVDLIVLDVMMPEVSGFDVLSEVRKTRSSSELPVIVATGRADPNDVVRALDLGANDHVAKPIDFDVLLARIRVQLRDSPGTSPARASASPGATPIFESKYEIKGKLGTGGFGSVYRARHVALDTFVAVKVLHTHLIDSDTMRQRFEIEGISACRVRHPNAVAVLDAGTTDQGAPYLVMELLEGASLQEELNRAGVLSVARVAEIVLPVCEVLQAAHDAGVVHRDIKPANIMLVHTARGETVKVLDFGIAKLMDEAREGAVTAGGQIVGTPHYMAPERLLERACDGRSDVYSVGATMFQMLSGRLAFDSSSTPLNLALRQLKGAIGLERIRPALPKGLVEMVMRCLAPEPERRPTLIEIAEVLRAAARDHVEPVWPPELIDVGPSTDAPDSSRASGYAETVALFRSAAETRSAPEKPSPGKKDAAD